MTNAPTDIVIDGGFPGGWLDTVVDFNFGRPFAAITFKSTWDGDHPTANNIGLNIPQLGIVGQASFNDKLIQNKAYHKETTGSFTPPNTTTTVYHVSSTWHQDGTDPQGHPFHDSGGGSNTTTVTSDGTFTFWAVDGTDAGGAGGIEGEHAYELLHIPPATLDSWSATVISGPTTSRHSPVLTYHEIDNEVFLFDLRAIKKQVGPKVHQINVQFDTGRGPVLVAGFQGAVDYVWTTTLETFSHASFTSLKISALALPAGWPNPKTSEQHKSGAGTPVPNQAIDYIIPF